MPVFTFEKISPPVVLGAAPIPAKSAAKKQRGVVMQIFNRFVETRVDRARRVEQVITRDGRDPSAVE